MSEKMNPEVRAAWVAKLREPGLPQTQGALERVGKLGLDPVGQCCLGVLCQLAVEAGVPLGVEVQVNDALRYLWVTETGEEMYESGLLPTPVRDWAGLISVNPQVGDMTLSGANDAGQAFAQIADLIERYL